MADLDRRRLRGPRPDPARPSRPKDAPRRNTSSVATGHDAPPAPGLPGAAPDRRESFSKSKADAAPVLHAARLSPDDRAGGARAWASLPLRPRDPRKGSAALDDPRLRGARRGLGPAGAWRRPETSDECSAKAASLGRGRRGDTPAARRRRGLEDARGSPFPRPDPPQTVFCRAPSFRPARVPSARRRAQAPTAPDPRPGSQQARTADPRSRHRLLLSGLPLESPRRVLSFSSEWSQSPETRSGLWKGSRDSPVARAEANGDTYSNP